LLYKESRDSKRIFTLSRLILVVIKSIILSGIIFIFCAIRSFVIDESGNHVNIWYMSLKNFCCILIIVSVNLFLLTKFIAYFLPLVVFITTFCFFTLFLLLVHYGLVFNFNSKASIFLSFSVPKFYLILLIVCSLSAVLDYALKIYDIFFVKSLSGQLSLKRALLTTDEAVRKEIMKNTSILRSDIKKEELKYFYRNSSSLNADIIDNKINKNNKNNESSLVENSQIQILQKETVTPVIDNLNVSKKSRNNLLVENLISKINNSIMSVHSDNHSSVRNINNNKSNINKDNNNNDFHSRQGIDYNGSFKGSKNNMDIKDYGIKINNHSIDEGVRQRKNSVVNIDTVINPFNNYLNYKTNIYSSKKSAFFGRDQMSNLRKSLNNNEDSENNIDNINDKSSNINNENQEGNNSNQNIKIYNVKKNNNFYLMLK
jgi:hypothetical protein